MSKKWNLNKQLAVYSKTNFRCAYCGKQLNFEPTKLKSRSIVLLDIKK